MSEEDKKEGLKRKLEKEKEMREKKRLKEERKKERGEKEEEKKRRREERERVKTEKVREKKEKLDKKRERNEEKKSVEESKRSKLPPNKSDIKCLKCSGCEDFECLDKVTMGQFDDVYDYEVLQYFSHHNLISNCPNCEIDLVVLQDIEKAYLLCPSCGEKKDGGHPDILGPNRKKSPAVAMKTLFLIVEGFSYQLAKKISVGIYKNTYTGLCRYVEQVCKYSNDKRRTMKNFTNFQADETVTSKRKYQRGKRMQRGGSKWCFTMVECATVESDGKKKTRSLEVDIRFCENNKRTIESLKPMIVSRAAPGASIYTDCWKAYPAIAKELKLEHFKVNHSKFFKDPKSGVHTNNVEGVHALIKRDSLRQFYRSPDKKSDIGLVLYLELAQWRVNRGLEARATGNTKNLFRSWLTILKQEVSDIKNNSNRI